LKELQKIAKILSIANAPQIQKELEKIATTPERKRIWVCIDGASSQPIIANRAGVNQSAVSRFLDAVVAAGLAEYRKPEPPRRILDYVPPDWIELTGFKDVTASEGVKLEVEKPITTLDQLGAQDSGDPAH
jgi:hypothetical protein